LAVEAAEDCAVVADEEQAFVILARLQTGIELGRTFRP
jgi:hypothetical protein